MAVAVTSCAGSGRPTATSEPATETTAADTTPATDDVEQQVLDAYQEFWRVWLRANNPPNPDDPDLARVATGAELTTIRQAIRRSAEQGTFTRLPPGSHYRHTPTVTSMDGPVAIVSDCSFDDAEIVDTSTGRVLNGAIAIHRIDARLRLVGSAWRVEQVAITNRSDAGVEPCAA